MYLHGIIIPTITPKLLEAIPIRTIMTEYPTTYGEIMENLRAAPMVPNKNGVKTAQTLAKMVSGL